MSPEKGFEILHNNNLCSSVLRGEDISWSKIKGPLDKSLIEVKKLIDR
jgi:hypothetical protein